MIGREFGVGRSVAPILAPFGRSRSSPELCRAVHRRGHVLVFLVIGGLLVQFGGLASITGL